MSQVISYDEICNLDKRTLNRFLGKHIKQFQDYKFVEGKSKFTRKERRIIKKLLTSEFNYLKKN